MPVIGILLLSLPDIHLQQQMKVLRWVDFAARTFWDTIQLDFAISKVLYVPGGQIPSLPYVWKLPSPAHHSEKSNLELHRRILNHIPPILNHMPKYYSRCHFVAFWCKFGDAMGPGAPAHLLQAVYLELTGEFTKMKRQSCIAGWLTQYLVSNCDPKFWPDMRALMNGGKGQYETFFDTLSSLVDNVTVVTANRHGEQQVLSSTNP
jgi:hypothetical protein